jgi:hypothetical protein
VLQRRYSQGKGQKRSGSINASLNVAFQLGRVTCSSNAR